MVKKALLSVVLLAAGLLLFARTRAFSSLLSANYLPHRYCYLAQPGLIWTNVTMDGLIAASYALIFACLFWIAFQLRELPAIKSYLWIFIAFGAFIVACGGTHLMEVITVWWPVYPLSATIKVICAAASVPTAILFARVSPALAANVRRFVDMLSTTEQEKNQAILALAASEKLAVAGRISASIAHEIKNPLDSIGNLLYLLTQDERMPADMCGMVETANSELARASDIARDTLSLFHTSDFPAVVSLSELVRGILDLQTANLVKHRIHLQPRLSTPYPLSAYASELRQILINLVQNAEAAIGSQGRILVRVQPRHLIAGNKVKAGSSDWLGYSITIADSGPGIERSHRAQLFTLFFTTKGEEGTGIGLWLVRSMVQKHGGRIICRSRTAAESSHPGTIFNVWIPLSAALTTSNPLQTAGGHLLGVQA